MNETKQQKSRSFSFDAKIIIAIVVTLHFWLHPANVLNMELCAWSMAVRIHCKECTKQQERGKQGQVGNRKKDRSSIARTQTQNIHFNEFFASRAALTFSFIALCVSIKLLRST